MAQRVDTAEEILNEQWEITTAATVWVWLYDRRNDNYRKQKVSGGPGGGSKKLTISVGDRRYNQELVIEEMKDHDPFTNGTLLRLSGPELSDDEEHLDISNHKTNAQLLEFFAITDVPMFQEAVDSLTSETLIRRLHSLAKKSALAWQLNIIEEVIDQRYRVGGTQPTVAQMIKDQDMQGGHAMS
jgi:hypothetical protein